MANLNGFDASQVDPNSGFDPVPAGKYLAVITASENKPTKRGNGEYLQLTFQIFEGEYKNRLLWVRLNLKNPNAEAVKIVRGELSAICRAAGVMKPADSSNLHHIPMLITVRCAKRDDTGDITNEISKYEPRPGATGGPVNAPEMVGAGAGGRPGPVSQSFNAESPPPWRR